MFAKILVGSGMVVTLAGSGYYAASGSATCCAPGAACCEVVSACCAPTDATVKTDERATDAQASCCAPGAACCPGPCCGDLAK